MPVGVSVLSFEDALELSVEQLKVGLESRYIESKGLSKPQMQKALIKSLSLEAPVVTQQPIVTQQPLPLTAKQQMELEVLKLRLQSEALEKKKRLHVEERKELHEHKRQALEEERRKKERGFREEREIRGGGKERKARGFRKETATRR